MLELSYKDKKNNLKFPTIITSQLAEFIGFHLGDGHYNLHKNHDYYFFYGGNKEEKDYYDNHIKKIIKELFNLSVKPREFKTVYGFYIRSKGLYNYFNEVLHIPKGKKNNLTVPEYILNGTKEIKCSFIRGLFDTDGSFNIKKNGKYNYPRITICSINQYMLEQVKEIIKSFDIKGFIYKHENIDKRTLKLHKRYVLAINGFKEVNKWIRIIGTNSNNRIKQISQFF